MKPVALDSYYRRLFSKEATDARGRQGYLVRLTSTGIGFERWANNYRNQVSVTTPSRPVSGVTSPRRTTGQRFGCT